MTMSETSAAQARLRRLPKQARGEQRVHAILEAAASLFDELGYDVTTTGMIASRAHTAIGSLYDFFPNKESIATSLAEKYVNDIRSLYERILMDDFIAISLSEAIDHIVDPLVQYQQTHVGLQEIWLRSQIDPHLKSLSLELDTILSQQMTAVMLRRNPQYDEVSMQRIVYICMWIIQGLTKKAVHGATIDEPIIIELKHVLLAYLRSIEDKRSESSVSPAL
jgi:AcrR family transcriptional regulator